MLPIEAIKIIRKLGLNRKRRRHLYTVQKRKLNKNKHRQSKSNAEFLINVKRTSPYYNAKTIMGTCNIQSLKNKDLQIIDLLTDYSLDLLALTETWLNDSPSTERWLHSTPANRDPYKVLIHNRENRRGGGVALIVKSDFATKLVESGDTGSFEYATWEVSIKRRSLTITVIYHPPYSLNNKSTNKAFLDDFTDYMAKLLSERHNNIVVGDFNLHVSNEENVDSAIFNDTIEAMGLYQHVSFPTHNAGNTLDLVISEIQGPISIDTTVPGPFISDHRAIISTLSLKKHQPKRTNREVRKLHKVDTEDWIKEFNPDNIELSNNLDSVVTSLGLEFKRTLDKLAPITKCSISLKPKMPWYDREMTNHKAMMRRREKKWLKYKLDSCWTAYKMTRNTYYGRLNTKKKSVLSQQITECANDSKKLHALINNLTTKPNPTPWPEHSDKEQLANEFADYFHNKILQIRKRFEGILPHNEPTDDSVPQLRKFAPMTVKEVDLIIKQMKTKSCELDDIPTNILKQMLPQVIGLITKIVNLSLEEGVFSTNWKLAVVRPLLKKIGLELINSNYRPVSNLPFISKVVEKCMLLQLSRHCEDFNLLPDYQSAYRENRSCETAVLRVSNDILWAFEKQSITSLVAIDLSAAFDTVDHTILLNILNCKFGITGKALKWFDSYLRPRSFKVLVDDNHQSKEKSLEVSVPQGSCAGANLFNIYCSPLEDVVPADLQLSGFADDHSIRGTFKAGNKHQEKATKDKIESCMLNIKHWMDTVRLKMNPSKTEFIYFGSKQQLEKCFNNNLDVAGDLIIRSHTIRYLGAHLDENLNYKQHVNKKCQAAMFNYFKIKGIRRLLDIPTATRLCLSLCISHLDYCNSLLYGLPDITLNRMQRVQNMCARLILRRSKRESITQCLKELHWLPIRQRITYKILTLTHKCLNGQGPKYLKELLTRQTSNRQGLRSSKQQDLLLRPLTRLKTFADRSFSIAAPTLWNQLPPELRQADQLTFKNKLKTHLFQCYFNG